ncbi:MAG TPA: DUF1440 domain-containing protein [Candidatus Acidoferrales bacterium]|nr:DUF1440 domain-containing protein [Candidatus Acidoferrales bacterium]
MTTSNLSPTHWSEPRPAAHTSPVSRAILYATLVVGVLDAADGIVVHGLHGQNPIQVLQYIASSLLGARSFSDGLASAGFGLVVHFAIALVVAAIYILASRRVAVLRTHWALLGLVYGAAVWAVMNLVVLPLTAVAPSPITTAAWVSGVMGHALFVGLPSAFFAKKVEA